MRVVTYGLIVLLAILHQDFWWWDDSKTVVFGFVPIGLAYHAGVSIAAALFWLMAVMYCWPKDADAVEEETDDAAPAPTGGRREF